MTADKPRTEAGRALLDDWKRDPKELWLVDDVADVILAIEAEAAQDRDSGLRADLRWMTDTAMPMHGAGCAGQDENEPCICGVSDRYEAILDRLAATPAPPTEPDVERLARAIAATKGDQATIEALYDGHSWLDLPDEWYDSPRHLATEIIARLQTGEEP